MLSWDADYRGLRAIWCRVSSRSCGALIVCCTDDLRTFIGDNWSFGFEGTVGRRGEVRGLWVVESVVVRVGRWNQGLTYRVVCAIYAHLDSTRDPQRGREQG